MHALIFRTTRPLMHTLCVLILTSAGTAFAAVPDKFAGPFASIDPSQTKVGGEMGRRIDLAIEKNLLAIEIENQFLSPFRTKQSHPMAYIGLGKLIDATVSFARYSKDPKVIALKDHLVKELIATQLDDGYIGLMAGPDRLWKLWDIHEMSYIILGLTNDYRYFGENASLEAARKTADYIIERWSNKPDNFPQNPPLVLHLAVIGLDRAMLTLYRETKDQRYLDFCTQQRALAKWDQPIVLGRWGILEGHVYAYLTEALTQLELYRLQPDSGLLRPTLRAMQFMTHEDGLTITGEVGRSEAWVNDQDPGGELGETCATAYQIRVYDSLLRMKGRSCYGDLIERTVFNALFAAQSPDGRQIRYYTPIEGPRSYFGMDTYCCPGNFRRIISELPAMVYYRYKTGVAVSLYTPSEAIVDLDDGVSLKVQQKTDYPATGHVAIQLSPSKPATFPLRLRIPRWCRQAELKVNGELQNVPVTTGDFATIQRHWTAGDEVTLDMPMSWRLVLGRKFHAGRAAVMRGPIVFCLDPAQSESLKTLDAAGLKALAIDPASLKDLPSSNHAGFGIDGQATVVHAGERVPVRLTAFPDPQGQCVYFRLPSPTAATPDELVDVLGDGL